MKNKIINDRSGYVFGKFFKCIYPVGPLEANQSYWFEYVNDGGEDFYRVLSDNAYGAKVHITDNELMNNFIIVE